MGTVRTVVEEEGGRLRKLLAFYDSRLSELPRGCLSLKERRGRRYAYLARREGPKVAFEYLGPEDAEAVATVRARLEERRKLGELRRQVVAALREVEAMLHA